MDNNLVGTVDPTANTAIDPGAFCMLCEAPRRQVWVAGEDRPQMSILDTGNHILVEQCPRCLRLWCQSTYNPFDSFVYSVRWYLSAADWRGLHDIDHGDTLLAWHRAALQALYDFLSPSAKEFADFHRRRSLSYNPFDYQVRPVPNLLALLEGME